MDDESRENEGDIMLLADRLTIRAMKILLANTTGIVCAAMTSSRAEQLHLPLMVSNKNNRDAHRTKFTLTVDAAMGISTGVSAADRMTTLTLLAKSTTSPTDLVRPGHVFPLVAADGGLLERRGHTEAGVELARLVGGLEHCVMVLSELYDKSTGRMMRAPQCRQLGLPMIHINGLSEHLKKCSVWASLPLQPHPGNWHVAVIAGYRVVACGRAAVTCQAPLVTTPKEREQTEDCERSTLALRIHSECFTGDVLGSSLCDCGNQLHTTLHHFGEREDGGMIIFPPEHEGLCLGHRDDSRHYETAVFVLKQLGILPSTHDILLFGENPVKFATIEEAGYNVLQSCLDANPTAHNAKYLTDKRHKCGSTSTIVVAETETAGNKVECSEKTELAEIDGKEQLVKKSPTPFKQLGDVAHKILARMSICFVQAEWHRHMSDPLVKSIMDELCQRYNFASSSFRQVFAPGSYELPRVIQHLASHNLTRGADTIYIAVGILVKGDTDHYDLVAKETVANLQRLGLDRELWIINCVLACHTMEQVAERCLANHEKCVAFDMAHAVVRLALVANNFTDNPVEARA